MKRNLLLTGLAIAAFSSCTVVYQNPNAGVSRSSGAAQDQGNYAYNNPNNQNYNNQNDLLDGDTTSDGNEPLITFNNNYYDNGYVYNPYYMGGGYYAGNPFWGVGLYPGWSWGMGYYPYGWGIGIGYGWGGYYGWGSLYYGWGGMYGWPGYYGWGPGWGWGGYHRYYSPYIVGGWGGRGNFLGRRSAVPMGRNGAMTNGYVGGRGTAINNSGFSRRAGNNNLVLRNITSNNTNGRITSSNGFSRGTARTYSTNDPRVYNGGSGFVGRNSSNGVGNFNRTYSTPQQQSYSRPQTQQSYSRPQQSYSAPSRSSSSFGGGGGFSRGGGGGFSRGGGRR